MEKDEHIGVGDRPDAVYIDGSRIVNSDVQAKDGIIHVVNRVIKYD